MTNDEGQRCDSKVDIFSMVQWDKGFHISSKSLFPILRKLYIDRANIGSQEILVELIYIYYMLLKSFEVIIDDLPL